MTIIALISYSTSNTTNSRLVNIHFKGSTALMKCLCMLKVCLIMRCSLQCNNSDYNNSLNIKYYSTVFNINVPHQHHGIIPPRCK